MKLSGAIFTFCVFSQILFLILKLTQAITWSWFWVLSPIWIPIAICCIIIITLLIFASQVGDDSIMID